MDEAQLIPVTGRDGLRGTLASPPPTDPNGRVEVRLDDGHRVTLPATLLRRSTSGRGYEIPLGIDDLRTNGREQVVVPVVQEQLDIRKRTEERGSVVIHVVPKIQTEVIDVPLAEERVEVQRVPVNRFVTGTQPVRQDGDVTVVPVYEEVLVVERRLMLKEEIHVTRRRQIRQQRQQVDLRSEEVEVLRSDRQG
jgi:stress response protein YsnF